MCTMTATTTRRVDVLCVYAHAARLIALLGQPDDSSWPVCVHDNNTYASAVDRRDPPARHVLLFRARAHPGSDDDDDDDYDDGDRNRSSASYITKTTIIIISYADSLIFPRPTRERANKGRRRRRVFSTIIVDNRTGAASYIPAKPYLPYYTVDEIADSLNNRSSGRLNNNDSNIKYYRPTHGRLCCTTSYFVLLLLLLLCAAFIVKASVIIIIIIRCTAQKLTRDTVSHGRKKISRSNYIFFQLLLYRALAKPVVAMSVLERARVVWVTYTTTYNK